DARPPSLRRAVARAGIDRSAVTARRSCTMLPVRIAALLLLVAVAAGCGGSGSPAGSSAPAGGGLVASVHDAKATVSGRFVTASAKIKLGGAAGKRLTLEWGLVDASLGQESQQERVLRRYVTTRKVVTDTPSIRFKRPVPGKPFLVHFVLYAPD